MLGLIYLLLGARAGTYVMNMARHSQECFVEKLKHGDRIEIGFDVVETNGDDKLDLNVINPDSSVLHSVTQEKAAAFGFYAGQEGFYQVCFYNKLSSADKKVSFTIIAPDEQAVVKKSNEWNSIFINFRRR